MPQENQQVTVSRMVHYTSAKGEILAAIVTGVVASKDGKPTSDVNLCVFTENGTLRAKGVKFSQQPGGDKAALGKWSWPVREGQASDVKPEAKPEAKAEVAPSVAPSVQAPGATGAQGSKGS